MTSVTFSDEIINDLRIKASQDKKAFTDKASKGLQLIVSWKGSAIRSRPSKSNLLYNWYFRFEVPHSDTRKRTQIKIGTWPTMNAKQALNEALRLRSLVSSGIDPRSEKLKQRASTLESAAIQASGETPSRLRFESILEDFCRDWETTGKTDKTCKDYRLALEKHAYPYFYGENIKLITGKQWDEMITDIAHKRKLPGAANNTHKAGRRLFAYAVDKDIIGYNPLLQRKNSLEATRLSADERFLEAEEVHKFLNEIDAQDIAMRAKVNLKLMMQVGVRVDEWERVKVGWINFKKMRIEHPPESMKNRTRAWTHLPPASIELIVDWLKSLKEEFGPIDNDWYLFPASDNPKRPEPTKLSDHTSLIKQWLAFSPKLIRKTISTHLQRQGCPPTVLRAIRNQTVTQGVENNYDFDDLFHLKKQWIETWGELLKEVKKDPKALFTEKDSVLDDDLSTEVDELFS